MLRTNNRVDCLVLDVVNTKELLTEQLLSSDWHFDNIYYELCRL